MSEKDKESAHAFRRKMKRHLKEVWRVGGGVLKKLRIAMRDRKVRESEPGTVPNRHPSTSITGLENSVSPPNSTSTRGVTFVIIPASRLLEYV